MTSLYGILRVDLLYYTDIPPYYYYLRKSIIRGDEQTVFYLGSNRAQTMSEIVTPTLQIIYQVDVIQNKTGVPIIINEFDILFPFP